VIRLLPLLLLASCKSLPTVDCASAEKVRTAAELTIRAIDRVCPMER
jgi:hypothetical protein